MIADFLAAKLASLGYATNGENVWAVLRRFRNDRDLATQDSFASYISSSSPSSYLNDDLYVWAVNAPPTVLGEAVFLIEASRPDGPPLSIPLLGATFWIDATRESD